MEKAKLVVGYLIGDEMVVKSVKISESIDWISSLVVEELVPFFEELLELIAQISEGKEDSETLRTFLDHWGEAASESEHYARIWESLPPWLQRVLLHPESDVRADITETEQELEDYARIWNSIDPSLQRVLLHLEHDVRADITEAEQELDLPWIDIVDVQDERDPLFPNIYREPEVADVTEQERDDYLTLSIAALRLPTRAHNCLKRENIYTLRVLVEKTESELLLISNFGMGSLQKVKAGLAPMGLYLGMDLDPEEIDEDEDYD